MTTRTQLQAEREALAHMLSTARMADYEGRAALTASIARIDALLSIDDEEAAVFVEAAEAEIEAFADQSEYEAQTRTLRALVSVIRRTP